MVFEAITNEHAPAMSGDREVHLWSVTVDIPADAQSRSLALLCDRERERARRFVSEAERRRFVVARAALRTLLARYLDTRSEAIHFDAGPFGKPCCRIAGGRPLHFNVSHSGEVALLAFSAAEEVGVDVELVRD